MFILHLSISPGFSLTFRFFELKKEKMEELKRETDMHISQSKQISNDHSFESLTGKKFREMRGFEPFLYTLHFHE